MHYYEETGLGYNRLQKQASGRVKLINTLINDGVWNSDKPHHLLGCSLAKEFRIYATHYPSNIYSCDTSNPIVAGLSNIWYNGEFGIETKPTAKLIEFIDHTPSDECKKIIDYNMHQFKRIMLRAV
jgi:hypothetical protein